MIIKKILVKKSYRKKWYWKALSHNNKCLCFSEEYSSRQKCLKTALSVAYQCLIPAEIED